MTFSRLFQGFLAALEMSDQECYAPNAGALCPLGGGYMPHSRGSMPPSYRGSMPPTLGFYLGCRGAAFLRLGSRKTTKVTYSRTLVNLAVWSSDDAPGSGMVDDQL
ncbi:hypothetical protein D3C76_958130 [compost metagenome]